MDIDNIISNSSKATIKFQRTFTPISPKRNLPNPHDTNFYVLSEIFDTYECIKNEVSCEY